MPAGLLGAWAAYVALKHGAAFGASSDMLAPDSFVFLLRVKTASHAAMGAAFVYLGALAAPAHRRRVGSIFGAAGLLISCACAFAVLMKHDYWAVWAGLCAAAGAAGTSYAMHVGRIRIDG